MSLEDLKVIGVDQNTPISIREKLALKKDELIGALKQVVELEGVEEAVILSTCNRTEVYTYSRGADGDTLGFLCRYSGLALDQIKEYGYCYRGRDGVKHLFEVACGLRSMVVGEEQILGQVKEAYEKSMEAGTAHKVLSRMFLDAISLGKKVRATTGIADIPLSVSYIAVKFIEQAFNGRISDKKVFVIGTGEMGRIVIKNLIAKGVERIYVTNRTHKRTVDLKKEFPQLTTVNYEFKYSAMADCDVIISATDAPHYTVNYDKFKGVYRGHKVCMVDIALPRDIDPRVAELPGVSLYTLDDLKRVSYENGLKRRDLIDDIEKMVEEAAGEYVKWLAQQKLVPMIKEVNEYAGEVCLLEFQRLKNKVVLTEREMEQVRIALHRVASKMVNRFIQYIKEHGDGG
ncbi:glutamyl-tRNA reductase [Caldanaerobius polysaccharolyticus]|uniref:glutamyl-tRNA reductase n=1 Tax=Caldanaerobius polysaccharolyticus TaxID=44256 RepID=UPI00047D09E9|nr:glutamyl-tRNA reductase [Caldanaerobius polysaccharolyticus]